MRWWVFLGVLVPFLSSSAAPAHEVVAHLSERQVYVYDHAHKLVAKFPIATARPGKSTPLGQFRVETKLEWPPWYPPEGGYVPGGPGNPLGERWIGFGGTYGFHGTTNQACIGQAVTRGCLRLRTQDILRLYELVEIGDPVFIQP
jgi:lipoprotein-anchoring transpeptidase ErfK/SrfK